MAAARKKRADIRYFRSAVSICLRSTRPRSQIATTYSMQGLFTLHASRHPEVLLGCYFSRAGGFPKVPATRNGTPCPPCVFRIPFPDAFHFSLFTFQPVHGTQEARLLCGVSMPAIRASQRYSTEHLLRYGSPFGFHFCVLFPQCTVRFGSTHWV